MVTMDKQYRMHVTNIDLAIAALKSIGIDAQSTGSYIQFRLDKAPIMEIIPLLNRKQIVIYDIEEI